MSLKSKLIKGVTTLALVASINPNMVKNNIDATQGYRTSGNNGIVTYENGEKVTGPQNYIWYDKSAKRGKNNPITTIMFRNPITNEYDSWILRIDVQNGKVVYVSGENITNNKK